MAKVTATHVRCKGHVEDYPDGTILPVETFLNWQGTGHNALTRLVEIGALEPVGPEVVLPDLTGGTGTGGEDPPSGLAAMTNKDLAAMAEARGLAVPKGAKKADLLALLGDEDSGDKKPDSDEDPE